MRKITPQLLEQIWENKKIRQRLAYENPLWFSLLYLRHHFSYSFAPFHTEMFYLISQIEYDFIAIMAFRESGKSTIMNTTNILWSILGKPEKKFVLIISKTQEQAKNHFLSMESELKNNEKLKEDFGPFIESEDDLKRLSLELVYHGAKIMSVTSEQSIRGLKYGQFRPDLIICDDLEDISSVFNSKESEIIYDRFQKEIIPIGSFGTRIVVLGNLLSGHSFMMRLKNDIEENRMAGIFRVYPLIDDANNVLWEERFPNFNVINKLKEKISTETWIREYLLTLENNVYGEPKELPPLKKDEKNNKIILERYHWKLAELRKRYKECLNKTKPQIPLIQQMERFIIKAPETKSFIIPELGDSRYEKYLDYKKEKDQIIKEFHEELKIILRNNILKKYAIG